MGNKLGFEWLDDEVNKVKLWVTRCKVAVKCLEHEPPDCKERMYEVKTEVRIRVRGLSPSCGEGWWGWKKRLIYWCRW